MTNQRRTPIMLGIAAALTLAACGSGSTSAKVSTSTAGPQRPSNSTDGAAAVPKKPTLPSVEVLDTANDQKVQFSSLLPAAKPVLFWFWAPH